VLESIENLEKALGRLPGFGRRSSRRAALALLHEPERLLEPLAAALREARNNVCRCSRCGAFTAKDVNPCVYCTAVSRDGSAVCVVEEPSDIETIEASGAFNGRYHVLGGKLSPAHKVGLENLRLAELRSRIENEGIKEVVLALSTDMEGDATAGVTREMLSGIPGLSITQLAFGLPADSGISYSDPLTLRRAIAARR
jgi:recombination protein RecR